MDPVTLGLITAGIPFLTALVKKLFKTTEKPGVNTLLPLAIGILSAGVTEYSVTHNVVQALTIGLGAGGVASSVRDFDKNAVGLIGGVLKLVKGKST